MTNNLPAVIEPVRKQDPVYHALRQLGVKELRITYSGSCNSGCINEVEALDKDAKLVALPQTKTPYTFTHTTHDFQAGVYPPGQRLAAKLQEEEDREEKAESTA